MTDPGPAGRDPLERLAEEFVERLRAGEHPSIEEYAKRHPDLAESIRDLLPAMVEMERLGGAETRFAPRAAEEDPGTRKTIGPYRIVRELGAGGMGIVYLAEDSRLSRRVALKVLTPSLASSAQLLLRFHREAEIASKLDHPSICTVYEAGESDGVAWIAMRYVEGETLAQWIDDHRLAERPVTREDVATVLRWTEEVARALHTAHEAGLIHRDVKPGNVMIDTEGRAVVLDFGLARPTEGGDDATLTQTGALLGTPAYMSPEQILSARYRLDRRTDVYSLGVTLYECLTLKRPFDAATAGALYQEILSSHPESPRRLNPTIGDDLRVVVQTAMDRDRDRRYATAVDFAEDVRRVREYEPIRARPASVALRLRRWAERNPVLATSTLGLFATLVVGLSVALHLLGEVTDERDLKDDALGKLQVETEAKTAALEESESSLRRARSVVLAHESLMVRDDDPMLSLLLAREGVRTDRTPAAVTQLHEALVASHWRAAITVPSDGDVTALAILPPDDLIVWGAGSGRAGVIDRTGRPIASLDCDAWVERIEVSRDGAGIAVSTSSETRLWTRDGSPVSTVPGRLVAGAANSDRLVVIDGKVVRVVDYSGSEVAVIRPPAGRPRCAAITSDGTRVATSAWSSAAVWDVETADIAFELPRHQGEIRWIAFSPHGGRIATRSESGARPPARPPVPHRTGGPAPPPPPTVGLSPQDQVLRLFRVPERPSEGDDASEIEVVLPAGAQARSAALTQTRLLATLSNGAIASWSLDGRDARVVEARGQRWAVSMDGSTAASYGSGVSFFSAVGVQQTKTVGVGCLAVSTDGRRAVSAAGPRPGVRPPVSASNPPGRPSRTVTVWDCLGGELPSLVPPSGPEMPSTAHIRGVWYAGDDGTVAIRVASNRGFFGTTWGAVFFAGDGRRLGSVASGDRTLVYWPDLDTAWITDGAAIPAGLTTTALCVRIDSQPGWRFTSASPSPRRDGVLAVRVPGDGDAEAVLYELDGRVAARFPLGTADGRAIFTPSGDRVATAHDFETIVLWGAVAVFERTGATWFEGAGVRLDLRGNAMWLPGGTGEVTLWDRAGHRVASISPPPAAAGPDRQNVLTFWDDDGREVRRIESLEQSKGPVLLGTATAATRTPGQKRGPLILTTPDGTEIATLERSVRGKGLEPYLPAWSSEGDRIAFIHAGGSIARQYFVRIDDVLRLADERVSRDFTREELERYQRLLGDEQRDVLALHVRVDRVFEEDVLQHDVLARISADGTLSDQARAQALRIATERANTESFISRKTRDVLAKPGRTHDEYARALRWAIAAERLDPSKPEVVTRVGMAHYRVADFSAALATLQRPEAKTPKQATYDVGRRAFVAMALAGLGRLDAAEQELAAIRAVVDEAVAREEDVVPEYLDAFREAEQLVSEARSAAEGGR